MDLQSGSQCSTLCSLDDALQNVSQDLVYDPSTKKLCIRSQSSRNSSTCEVNIHEKYLETENGSTISTKSTFSEFRKHSDGDSGYCGLSSDSNTEGDSQKSLSETRSDILPLTNENVDDLDLSICSQNNESSTRLGKSKVFIQNVLSKLTSTVSNSELLNEGYLSNSCDSLSINSDSLTLRKRPLHLPPKSEDEERRHQAQFNEILKQAKKRELKDLKIKKRILSKQIRQEDEISSAIRFWTNDILPNWPLSNATKRTKELWWSGIPSAIRPKVWSLAIGNDLSITEELFRICVERSKERLWTKQFICRRSSNPYPSSKSPTKHHRRVASQPVGNKQEADYLCVHNLASKLKEAHIKESDASVKHIICESSEDEEDKNESVSYLIKLDVSRTFPQLGLFQHDAPYHQSLSEVLAAYVVYRPDLGYCQGMSFLAAMLLLNLESPSNAFTAFANLLNNELLLCFYRLNQDQMKTVYEYYDRQLQAVLPRLASHFTAIGLSTELFFVDQLYTIFSRSLPLECVCRVWDLFLRDGNEFIFRASLAILAMYEETLLLLDFVAVAQFLSRLPEDMDTDKYFQLIASIRLMLPQLPQFTEINCSLHEKSTEANTSLVKKIFHL